jgi:hypothetical protein
MMCSRVSTPSHSVLDKTRSAARLLAVLASAALLGVASARITYGAENPTDRQITAGSSASIVRVQPNANQFAPSRRPDVSPVDAKEIGKLYRELIGLDPDAAIASPGPSRSTDETR